MSPGFRLFRLLTDILAGLVEQPLIVTVRTILVRALTLTRVLNELTEDLFLIRAPLSVLALTLAFSPSGVGIGLRLRYLLGRRFILRSSKLFLSCLGKRSSRGASCVFGRMIEASIVSKLALACVTKLEAHSLLLSLSLT